MRTPIKGVLRWSLLLLCHLTSLRLRLLFLMSLQSVITKGLHKLFSLCPMWEFDTDFDVGVERVDDNPSDGPQERFVLYADSVL